MSSVLPMRPLDAAALSSVLAEIAETASETLELREVFDRIATSVRRVIPFDHMGVVQIQNEVAVQHASTFDSCYLAVWEAQGTEAQRCGAETPECMRPCP